MGKMTCIIGVGREAESDGMSSRCRWQKIRRQGGLVNGFFV
jgi:hypothetical protein